MCARVKVESGRSGAPITSLTTLAGDDARILNWTRDAWDELQRRPHRWAWMRRELSGPCVIGQRAYLAEEIDLEATDFDEWFPPAEPDYEVTADGMPLRWLPWEKFRAAFELRAHEPGPVQYYSFAPDKRLYLGPTPADARLIRASYYKRATELVEAEDEPDMPSKFHIILVWRALMELASFDAAPEVYSRALVNFNNVDHELVSDQGPKVTIARARL